jgi:Fe-S cluster assembly iron-binding protein IscA
MSKHNLLIKKTKKQILYINNLIESNFNKLKYFKSNFKKIISNRENRVVLGFGIAVILTLFYFLLPTFYNKNLIQTQIKNQVLKNYGIDIKFNEKINYGLLPKPHFSAKNLLILRNNNEIGITRKLKVFIGIGHFFSINKLYIKDLVFNKSEFNFNLDDFSFFKNLLKTAPNENKIFFKKSKIFFKNKDDDLLFIKKINNSKFYYDANNLQNVLIAKNEIFNVPFKLIIKNDKFNKKVITKFNSKQIRLNIDIDSNYNNEGLIDILSINKDTSIKYKIDKNSLNLISLKNKNSYNVSIDFKPFYLSGNFKYEGLSSKNLFNDKSILVDLINSKILNNKNLSANLDFNIKDITNSNQLNNLNLKVLIEEGNINFSNSTILWKDNLKITFSESVLLIDEDGINLIGTTSLDFKDIKNFYTSFQIPKKNRKDINQIKIDFVYNLNSKAIRFDNPKINSVLSSNLAEFLDNFNSEDERVFNKITFKNFINNFFEIYAG